MTSMSWGNDAGGNDSDPTKKAAHEGAPVASVKKRPSKMPVIEIGHLLAERRQHQSRQPTWAASFEPDEGGGGQQMAAKLPAGLRRAVPESFGSMKRLAESSNFIEATPKRVKGITHPAHSFGSRGSPVTLAELGNGVENMGSRKNELHMGQSTTHLPSQPTAPAARTAALTFWQDECDSIECGAVMSVCSKGRGRATVHDIPTVPNSVRLQLSGDAPQQETDITEKGTTSCCAATLNTIRSIREKEPSESQCDLVSANEAPEALLSNKREASSNGAKRIAGQLIESPALAKVTFEREMLKIGEVAHSQHDYSNSAQFHGNKIAAVSTSAATSMNRCVPLKEPISSSAMKHAADASLPDFRHLVNFPGYIGKHSRDGKRHCVMCGTSCLVVRSGGSESLEPVMNYRHRGVCLTCEVLCWKVSDKDLVVKFCYQSKEFKQWASAATSMNCCVPLKERISSSAMEHAADASLPAFRHLVNFPGYIGKHSRDGKRRCVMCGTSCLVVRSGGSESLEPVMNFNHSGVCKACAVLCWKVSDRDLVVKFCYLCSKFRQWAVFGEKGRLKFCDRCRFPAFTR